MYCQYSIAQYSPPVTHLTGRGASMRWIQHCMHNRYSRLSQVRLFWMYSSVKIMLGLSLFSVFNIICFIYKTKHVARTILTGKRVRLRVRERVAFPYTFAVHVVNLNLSNLRLQRVRQRVRVTSSFARGESHLAVVNV